MAGVPSLRDIVEHDYPHTNLNDYNLDWIIQKIVDLEKAGTWVINDVYDPITRTLNLSLKSLGGE